MWDELVGLRMQCDSGLLGRGWKSSTGLNGLTSPFGLSRGPPMPDGTHPLPNHSVMEIILVNFKAQKISKKWILPRVLKAVSSGLLSCIENLKNIFSYIEHLCFISLTHYVNKLSLLNGGDLRTWVPPCFCRNYPEFQSLRNWSFSLKYSFYSHLYSLLSLTSMVFCNLSST